MRSRGRWVRYRPSSWHNRQPSTRRVGRARGETSDPSARALRYCLACRALKAMPFAVHGDITSGPGIFDMKCGLVQGFWGIKAMREAAGVDRQVVLLCNSDEELGSPHSRPLIEESARDSRATLVLEPSLGGVLKTSRKGESRLVGACQGTGCTHRPRPRERDQRRRRAGSAGARVAQLQRLGSWHHRQSRGRTRRDPAQRRCGRGRGGCKVFRPRRGALH
jgi:hypothetical protein